MATENEQAIAEIERLEAEVGRLKAESETQLGLLHTLSIVEQAAQARAKRTIDAITEALACLGTGACKIHPCEACAYERTSAIDTLQGALAEGDADA